MTYYYVVSAINGDGEGLNSSEVMTIVGANTGVYEAEAGTLSGGASVNYDAYASGGQFVGGLNNYGASDKISNVDGGSGGQHTLAIQ